MTPARILFLNPTAQLGGAEYSLLDLAGALDRGRFKPTMACAGEGPLVDAARERDISVRVLEIDRRVAEQSLKGTRSGVAGLAAAALRATPLALRVRELAAQHDIVHTNGNKAHVLGAVAKGRAHLIWHVRDFWGEGTIERGMVRLANARARLVIANSLAVATHLRLKGISESRIHAVPNGIDTTRFTPDGPTATLREELGWPREAPVVGIVGMLARWKGQHVLLRAVADLLRRRTDLRCVIAGDEIYVTRGHSGYAGELRQLARDLGIQHAVAFLGYRQDVPALLRTLDVVVHASVEPEPFGRVVAEAMACARPVIATDAGGVPEVTGPHGAAALLVPCDDAPALGVAIERLLGDPEEARRLGRAARQRIVSSFALHTHVARIEALYESLLAPGIPRVATSGVAVLAGAEEERSP